MGSSRMGRVNCVIHLVATLKCLFMVRAMLLLRRMNALTFTLTMTSLLKKQSYSA